MANWKKIKGYIPIPRQVKQDITNITLAAAPIRKKEL